MSINFFFRPIDKPLFKKVMLLAFPIIVSNVSRVFMHITDTAMVGQLGKNQLVAVSMAGMILWIVISIGVGLRAATQAVTSRRLGEGKLKDCGTALRNAQLICFFLMLPISFLGLFFSDYIVPIYISDPGVIPLCEQYLSIASLSVYFSVSAFIFQGFYSGIEETKVLMYVTIISNLLNVYLNAGLIYGSEYISMYFDSYGIPWFAVLWYIYDFPALEVTGAAISTLISSILMVFLYLLYLLRSSIRIKYEVIKFKLDRKMIKKQIEIAYPQSISEVLLNFAFNLFYIIMGMIGTVQLAATQVVFAVAHASFLPAVGVGQACATFVGKYLGSNDIKKSEQSMIEGLRGALLIMGSMGIIFILFPAHIVSIFTNDLEIFDIGVKILPWVGVLQFVDVFAITLWFALTGAGDTKFTAYVTVLVSWGVFIPLSYILGIYYNLGFWGPWIAFGVYLVIEAVLIIFRVQQGKWKHIKV